MVMWFAYSHRGSGKTETCMKACGLQILGFSLLPQSLAIRILNLALLRDTPLTAGGL